MQLIIFIVSIIRSHWFRSTFKMILECFQYKTLAFSCYMNISIKSYVVHKFQCEFSSNTLKS